MTREEHLAEIERLNALDRAENLRTLERIERDAAAFSLKHPGMYVTLFQDFGPVRFWPHRRLNVHTPTDGPCWIPNDRRAYWKNGKKRLFTDRQKIADQNATPTLS